LISRRIDRAHCQLSNLQQWLWKGNPSRASSRIRAANVAILLAFWDSFWRRPLVKVLDNGLRGLWGYCSDTSRGARQALPINSIHSACCQLSYDVGKLCR
jgi:hypothetical protein